MVQCKMPGCLNELPEGRTYQCPACSSRMMDAFNTFTRPISEILNLGDLEEDVTPNPYTDSNQEPDRSGESATGNDSVGTERNSDGSAPGN